MMGQEKPSAAQQGLQGSKASPSPAISHTGLVPLKPILPTGLGIKHPLQLERASHRDRQACTLLMGRPVEQLLIVTTQLLTASHAHVARCLQVLLAPACYVEPSQQAHEPGHLGAAGVP